MEAENEGTNDGTQSLVDGCGAGPIRLDMTHLHRRIPALFAPLLLLLPSCAAPAQEAVALAATSALAPIAAPASTHATPALWKVADKDTTIWLFGTIHILPPGIEWYAGPITQAFEASDTLVTEIVDANEPQAAAAIARIALSDPPSNLRDQLTPDVRRAFEDALATMGLPKAALDANDPWYAAVALSTLPLMKDGYGTMNGVEAQLLSRAKARSMPHVGLETPEMQVQLFDSLPHETQVAYLAEVLKSFPNLREEVREMIDTWKAGKADELARLMNEEESDPLLMKVLLVDRNKAWAGWLQERLKQPGTVFVAVGAGHLAGNDSVQAQLAGRQIKVKRVQ
ncbi:TraB/GumN family protein [Novosphingobium sp. RD2P27]|uniref:TraB/GumN family protein n=1 Tax=Novosphingobium kalidii TaxID=3230299 RepID=A0ABV2D2E7_9SPHN